MLISGRRPPPFSVLFLSSRGARFVLRFFVLFFFRLSTPSTPFSVLSTVHLVLVPVPVPVVVFSVLNPGLLSFSARPSRTLVSTPKDSPGKHLPSSSRLAL